MVIEAPATGNVETGQKRVFTARTMKLRGERSSLFITVRMNQFEEVNNPAGRNLHAFELIKPDALALEAKIECDDA